TNSIIYRDSVHHDIAVYILYHVFVDYDVQSLYHDRETTIIYTLSLHDALPICRRHHDRRGGHGADLLRGDVGELPRGGRAAAGRSEEHTSELQSRENLVCRLLLEKKKM